MMLKDHKGCMPAHHAAMEGHTDCLKLLATNTTDLIGLLHAKNNDVRSCDSTLDQLVRDQLVSGTGSVTLIQMSKRSLLGFSPPS